MKKDDDLLRRAIAAESQLATALAQLKEADERASVIYGYLVDIREKAALIANNAPEEKQRFTGRQIILMSSSALGEGCGIKSIRRKES